MINTDDKLLNQVDDLLRVAQQVNDQGAKDTAIREATRLLRIIREQREILAMPADLCYLVDRFEGVIQ